MGTLPLHLHRLRLWKLVTSDDPCSYPDLAIMDAGPPAQPYIRLTKDRDIRVLYLLPGGLSDDLACEVHQVSLDSDVSYECLSYRWGHEESGSIKLGEDASLALNPNLLNALHHLRLSDTMRVLWADQICINQADNLEKTKQVGLMGEIYQKASKVVAWLGLPDEKTASTFEFLKNLSHYIVARVRFQGTGSPNSAGINDTLLEAMIQEYPTSLPQWTDARTFLERDWFARIWILQEIVLAPNVLIQCGEHTLSWEILDLLATILVVRPKNDITPTMSSGRFALEMARARTIYHQGTMEMKQSFLAITALLKGMREREATDPRDRVYGLLSIAIGPSESNLWPDYTKDWPEVYTDTTKSLLAHDKKLSILKLVEVKAQMETRIPSWVPDLRSYDELNFWYQPRLIIRPEDIYRSAGNTFIMSRSVSDAKLLALRGLYVGSITSISRIAGNIMGNVALGARVLDGGEWFQFAQGCAKNGMYPPTGEPLIDAFARLRIGDQLIRTVSERRMLKPAEYPSPGNFTYSESGDRILRGDRDDIGSMILSQTTRRRLFITDTGYMGLTHRSNKVEDKVYVLLGGDMPFVLRPKNKHFLFRGEAYVHGIMDGEALTKARQNVDPSWVPQAGWFEELKGGTMPFETEEVILE